MRRVINGSVYDTEKAKDVITRPSDTDDGYYYMTETLHRTKSGKYFLHGIGGPGSKYGKWDEHGEEIPGEEIVPMTERRAEGWVAEHFPEETYDVLFGDPEVDETTQLSLTVPKSLHRWLKSTAAESNLSMNTLACMIMETEMYESRKMDPDSEEDEE